MARRSCAACHHAASTLWTRLQCGTNHVRPALKLYFRPLIGLVLKCHMLQQHRAAVTPLHSADERILYGSNIYRYKPA